MKLLGWKLVKVEENKSQPKQNSLDCLWFLHDQNSDYSSLIYLTQIFDIFVATLDKEITKEEG